VHADLQRVLEAAEARAVPREPIDRFSFSRRTASADLVVATTEDRPYGCFLVTKGVVAS
jgi:L-fucose mutarotase